MQQMHKTWGAAFGRPPKRGGGGFAAAPLFGPKFCAFVAFVALLLHVVCMFCICFTFYLHFVCIAAGDDEAAAAAVADCTIWYHIVQYDII